MIGLVHKVFLKAIGGTRNERIVRSRMKFVREQVNPLEPMARALSDDQMRAKTPELRRRLAEGEGRDSIKAEAFALVREASRRARDHRQFDVQLVAGLVLDEGWIAEEATGEGKTIACYPAIYMAALEGLKVHLVTTNDYLVQRDAEFARPIFELMGLRVGYITQGMDNEQRKPEYACDVTYGMGSEFGFDYLRDNMKLSVPEQVQGRMDLAIVDEVDNILIDDARTPLIISGPAYGQTDRFRKADVVVRELIRLNRAWDASNHQVEGLKRTLKALEGEKAKAKGEKAPEADKRLDRGYQDLAAAEEALSRTGKYYEVELDKKSAHMTSEGVSAAQEAAGVGSFYMGANMEWPHLMEQALRAHLVYERDKDYVVRDGSVLIVDEFTGRILEGRQWSDGLHQAVEAKENVPIKQENQTVATITYQNFFRMYKKLSGMTGTAMTEAQEFLKIYKLDVASVPTHRPVNRMDHNDRIYADLDAKYDAIIEEINTHAKAGRPVLVGTTSIEKSEKISQMLTHRYGIEHRVLNGRIEESAVEGEIVKLAGQQRPLKKDSKEMVGNVTIATNMAGRGTDIKLGPGVVFAGCKVPPAEKLAELGVAVEAMFPPGMTKCCIYCPQYDGASRCDHCFKPKLDADFPDRGRLRCRQFVPCGLHVVGTERHEARRIDNQLRGRSGRQGDPGSGRFFLSLRDDLMAIFAGEWTLKVLGWLGLSGDVAIEDRRISKGVERAQKKVEERNFDMRKNVLEYDEVMDQQRRAFYGQRQQVLEGRALEGMVLDMLRRTIADAVEDYLDGKHAHRCIAEWARTNLLIPLRDDQVRAGDAEGQAELEADLRQRAKEEVANIISMELGEYMDADMDPGEWNLRGLSSWAMSRFNANLSQNQLRKMQLSEVEAELVKAAEAKIDHLDLLPLEKYLQAGFAEQSLAEWAINKFGIPVTAEEATGDRPAVAQRLIAKVEAEYRRREIEYPAEYALERTVAAFGTENVYAVNELIGWVKRKYQTELAGDDVRDKDLQELRARLVKLSEEWTVGGRLEQTLRQRLGGAPAVEAAIALAAELFDTVVTPKDLQGDIFQRMGEIARRYLRREMTELERFVLLQIYDTSWMDHLLAMDHLKGGIGLRSYAEQDPRVAYKHEGSRLFQDMLEGVRRKVTDMIFKVRLSGEAQMSSVYQISSQVHEQLSGYDHFEREMATGPQVVKVQTIRREVPKVGRNDPCPCGSGKKFKACCGQGQ